MKVHRAIVVTGFRKENVTAARRKAMEIFEGKECEVTRLTYRGAHGITSFMVAPDGTLDGSTNEARILRARQQYAEWLNANSGLFDFIEVEIPCKKAAMDFPPDKTPYRHLTGREQKYLRAVEVVLNRLFEPDPPIDIEEVYENDIGRELDFELQDYIDVLVEIEKQLPIKFDDELKTIAFRPPFNTVRDILHLIHAANGDDAPPQIKRRRKPRG